MAWCAQRGVHGAGGFRRSGNFSLRPPAELRRALEALGVHALRPVVVYTQVDNGDAVPIAAARLAWCAAPSLWQGLVFLKRKGGRELGE